MNFFHRLQMIYESSMGRLLFIFFILLFILTIIYIFLRLRQRANDLLAYQYQSHYEKVKTVLSSLNFVGKHKGDFLGRETVVKIDQDNYGVCLVPPPNLLEEASCGRFQRYHRLLQHQELPVFSRYAEVYDKDFLVVVQNGMVRGDGRLFPTLREYCLDRQLSIPDAELILLELARALSILHDNRTDQGESLYYGYLLPRSIFLSFDTSQRIDRITLSNHGIPFALGAPQLCKRLHALSKKQIYTVMEEYYVKELLDEMIMLSPEQRDPKRVGEVGPLADVYSFGALAVMLFCGKRFEGRKKIENSKIPDRWRPFVISCLEEDPSKRPQDFLELQDRLYDPEMALTHRQGNDENSSEIDLEENSITLSDLAKVLKEDIQNQEKTSQEGIVEVKEKDSMIFEKLIVTIRKFLERGKWGSAKEYLQKAYSICPNSPEVNVGMAIVCYEEGDLKRAEKFYFMAKEKDPCLAKRFREHIAFRV